LVGVRSSTKLEDGGLRFRSAVFFLLRQTLPCAIDATDIAFAAGGGFYEFVQSTGGGGFDVLRATTTMTAALAAGVGEIRVFGDIDSAVRRPLRGRGETVAVRGSQCLAPPGFDLGNSPGALTRAAHAGRTLFMSTTNGTRAIIAARSAGLLLAGAIVNASAVAQVLARTGMDVTLLCAGTNGEPAIEDVIGRGRWLTRFCDWGEWRRHRTWREWPCDCLTGRKTILAARCRKGPAAET